MAKKIFEYSKKKFFFSVERIVTSKEIDMATIDTEFEILKLKIAYRRKVAIFQNLRRKNAGEEFEFYIIIEKNL
jgi:hypothetical protein